MIKKSTDWDAYYVKHAKASSFTRKSTENILIQTMLNVFKEGEIQHICELGGANSCFFSPIRHQFPDAHYTIVDNNHTGMSLFATTHSKEKNIHLVENDIMNMPKQQTLADVVFSTGLIEHFSIEGTKQSIHAHFDCVKSGGLVIITFPTPTWLYRLTRSLAEIMGLWIFHDERPLQMQSVIDEMKQYGEILFAKINWWTILTQGVVVVRLAKK